MKLGFKLGFEITKVNLEEEKVKDFIDRREKELNDSKRGKSRGFGIDKTPLIYTQVGLEEKDKELNLFDFSTDKDYIFHQDIEDEENLIKQLEDDKFLDYAETEIVIRLIRNKLDKVKEVLKRDGDNLEIIRKQRKMKETKEMKEMKESNESNESKKSKE